MSAARNPAEDRRPTCRFCGAPLDLTVVDLGMSPLCESLLSAEQARQMEPFFPLRVFACEQCYLVQLEAFVAPDEIFSEYAYFSAYSTAWVEHAKQYVEMISGRLGLGDDDLVVELVSNDGYLLQHFVHMLRSRGALEDMAVVWQLVDTRASKVVRRFMMPLVVSLADVVTSTGHAVAHAHPVADAFGDSPYPFFMSVDFEKFTPEKVDRDSSRLSYAFYPEDVVLVSVGNLNPQKGMSTSCRRSICSGTIGIR